MKILTKLNIATVIFTITGVAITAFCVMLTALIVVTVGLFSKRLKLKYAHQISKLWGALLALSSFPKFHITGIENYDIKKTYIITPKHQSSFDIFFGFYLFKGHFCFISKEAYFKFPGIGYAMREAGYIVVKRGTIAAVKMIEDTVNCLNNGRSVVLYPEGTRSIDGDIRFPKKGLIKVAEQCEDIEILPVIIDGSKNVMKTGAYKISFGENINVKFLPSFKLKDIPGDENAKLTYWHELMSSEVKNMQNQD